MSATPSSFRFSVKAQRGGSMRALMQDPGASVPWLVEPLSAFGERLGTVLFRIPSPVRLDLARLATLLDVWPRDVPLTVEFQDPSWHVDEVFDCLRKADAALCATDTPDDREPPSLRLTGRFLYLRLRREDYAASDIEAWSRRLAPFLDAGTDAFVFFRHDATGRGPELAAQLAAAVRRGAED